MQQQEYYSHTKLDTFRKCALMFKYQYIDKIEVVDGDTSASDFGNLVHETAENYKGGGKVELLALYHKFSEKYKLTDFYKSKVSVALQNIHEYWKHALINENVKEYKHESNITVSLDDKIKLGGKIDVLIEQKDGRYKIVDYKTNKSNYYANHNNQLSMYMLILNKKYEIPYDKIDCEIVYLALDDADKKGNPIKNTGYENISKTYKLEECDVACLISEIETINIVIQKSIAKNEWKAKPGKFNCTYCPYNEICDKKWIPEEKSVDLI